MFSPWYYEYQTFFVKTLCKATKNASSSWLGNRGQMICSSQPGKRKSSTLIQVGLVSSVCAIQRNIHVVSFHVYRNIMYPALCWNDTGTIRTLCWSTWVPRKCNSVQCVVKRNSKEEVEELGWNITQNSL